MDPKYKIDFDKVKTFEDMKLILESLDLSYTEECVGLQKIKHLLKPIEDA